MRPSLWLLARWGAIAAFVAVTVPATSPLAAPPASRRTLVVLTGAPLADELTERLAAIPELIVQDPTHVVRPAGVADRDLLRTQGADFAIVSAPLGIALFEVAADRLTPLAPLAKGAADHGTIAAVLQIAEILELKIGKLTRAQLSAPSMLATVAAARDALAAGKLEEAQRLYKLATLDAVPRRSTLILGARLAERASPAMATTAWDELLGRLPFDAVALNNRGLALREAGRFDEAETSLRSAQRTEPAWTLPRINLAVTALERLRPGDALLLLEPIVTQQPDAVTSTVQLALALRHTGQAARAVELLRRLLVVHPTELVVQCELLHALVDATQLDAARALAGTLPEAEAQVRIARARLALASGTPAETVKLLDDMPSGGSRTVQRRRAHLLAVTHLQQRDAAAARAVLEPHLASDPFDAEGLYNLALALATGSTEPTRALGLVERARKVAPTALPLGLLHARLLIETAQPKAATTLLAIWKDADPRLTILRAHAQHLEGQSVAACKALGAPPPAEGAPHRDWLYLRAEACLAAGDRAAARAAARAFLAAAPATDPQHARATQLAR